MNFAEFNNLPEEIRKMHKDPKVGVKHLVYVESLWVSQQELYQALDAIMEAVKECEQDENKSIVDCFTEEMEIAANKALDKARGETE